MHLQKRISLPWVCCFLLALSGCAGGKTTLEPFLSAVVPELPPAPMQLPTLWSKKLNGAISGLTVSKNGRVVLVSTSPDHDIEGSSDHYLLNRLDDQGRMVWQQRMKTPIKEQDLSADGELAVMANYENQIFGLNAKGKQLWQSEGTCKPIILQGLREILCYHDDDAEPQVAYDLYNWDGVKIFSYPIAQDVLALKMSYDEQNLVLALAQGQIILMDKDLQKPIWKKRIEGEVIDIAVANGETPRVAVLYKDARQVEKVAVLDPLGRPIGVFSPTFRALQLEMDPQGNSVFYYGNNSVGQYLGSAPSLSWKEKWKRGGAYFTDYSYSISIAPDMVWMGYEEMHPDERQSHLLGFDYEGNLLKDFRVNREQSAYLYTQKISSRSAMMIVGSDDGRVSAFKLQ